MLKVPSRPTDSPTPEIVIKILQAKVMSDRVRFTVQFTPYVNGIQHKDETRYRDFPREVAFIDMLEDVPNIFTPDWHNYREGGKFWI